MNPLLKSFYNNVGQREEVKSFMIEVLGDIAKGMVFDGEDTKGIKEARDCIEKSFDKLEEIYGIIQEGTITNSK